MYMGTCIYLHTLTFPFFFATLHCKSISFRRERQKYYSEREKSRREPTKYICMIIDGMDQTKTNIPRVTSSKSNQHLWKLRTHLTGKMTTHLIRYCDMQKYTVSDNPIYVYISLTTTLSTTYRSPCTYGVPAGEKGLHIQ